QPSNTPATSRRLRPPPIEMISYTELYRASDPTVYRRASAPLPLLLLRKSRLHRFAVNPLKRLAADVQPPVGVQRDRVELIRRKRAPDPLPVGDAHALFRAVILVVRE